MARVFNTPEKQERREKGRRTVLPVQIRRGAGDRREDIFHNRRRPDGHSGGFQQRALPRPDAQLQKARRAHARRRRLRFGRSIHVLLEEKGHRVCVRLFCSKRAHGKIRRRAENNKLPRRARGERPPADSCGFRLFKRSGRAEALAPRGSAQAPENSAASFSARTGNHGKYL